MKSYYYIFKNDHLAEKTTYICGGMYDNDDSCDKHWRIYSYGLYDAFNVWPNHHLSTVLGSHQRSVRFVTRADESEGLSGDIEFFMLLGYEGEELIRKITKHIDF